MSADSVPSLPSYPPPAHHGVPIVTRDEQKPLLKIMGRMMAKRLHLPRGRTSVVSSSVKIKHKKVKYW